MGSINYKNSQNDDKFRQSVQSGSLLNLQKKNGSQGPMIIVLDIRNTTDD